MKNSQTIEFKRLLDLRKLLTKKSFFLFGPRSTGKSTLVEQQLPDAKVYDLLDDDVYQKLLRWPKAVDEEIEDQNRIIVIDEVQKLPKILDEAHRIIKKRNCTFLLTGSSARKLRKGSANLLGGRAWEAHLHPLTSQEIPGFDLNKYINVGGLPHVYLSKYPDEELKNYVNLYIREEIIAEAIVRNIDHFVRFLDVFALSNGDELNYQSLSNDSGVGANTIKNYVEILEDTLVGFQVRPFLATKTRKAITRSRFFLFDLGVTNKLAKRSQILEDSELYGKSFEHFIARELKSYLSYSRSELELCYWRSTSMFEVDFIIGNKLAIEVKTSKQVNIRHLKGLKALREEGLIENYIVVSRDSDKRMIDGIKVYPWKVFLKELWGNQLI